MNVDEPRGNPAIRRIDNDRIGIRFARPDPHDRAIGEVEAGVVISRPGTVKNRCIGEQYGGGIWCGVGGGKCLCLDLERDTGAHKNSKLKRFHHCSIRLGKPRKITPTPTFANIPRRYAKLGATVAIEGWRDATLCRLINIS